jgi:hypothetical protein
MRYKRIIYYSDDKGTVITSFSLIDDSGKNIGSNKYICNEFTKVNDLYNNYDKYMSQIHNAFKSIEKTKKYNKDNFTDTRTPVNTFIKLPSNIFDSERERYRKILDLKKKAVLPVRIDITKDITELEIKKKELIDKGGVYQKVKAVLGFNKGKSTITPENTIPPPPAAFSGIPPPAAFSGIPPPAAFSGIPPPAAFSGIPPPAAFSGIPPPAQFAKSSVLNRDSGIPPSPPPSPSSSNPSRLLILHGFEQPATEDLPRHINNKIRPEWMKWFNENNKLLLTFAKRQIYQDLFINNKVDPFDKIIDKDWTINKDWQKVYDVIKTALTKEEIDTINRNIILGINTASLGGGYLDFLNNYQ